VFSESGPSKKLKTSSLSTTTINNHLSDASSHFKINDSTPSTTSVYSGSKTQAIVDVNTSNIATNTSDITTNASNLSSHTGNSSIHFQINDGTQNSTSVWSSAKTAQSTVGVIGTSIIGGGSGLNVSALNTIVLGNSSANSSISGADNIVIGSSSAPALTNGVRNVLIGRGICNTMTSGSDNLVAGYANGSTMTTNSNCVVMGKFSGVAAGCNNSTAIGYQATALNSDEIVLGGSTQTVIRNSGSGTCDLGSPTYPFKNVYANLIGAIDGVTTSQILSSVTLANRYRYQAFSYYGTTPTPGTIDSPTGWMLNIGGSLTLGAVSSSSLLTKKYRVLSNPSSVGDSQRSGWLSASTAPPLFIGTGFKLVISFGITDTTTQAAGPTRTMVGLFQSATAPTLSSTATIASITTQSMGIVQESNESVWSFNTRGSGGSTKIATSVSCSTPSSTWFVLEIFNPSNSADVTMTLTDEGTNQSEQQTFTSNINNSSIMSDTSQCYLQLQRSMAKVGGATGSAQQCTASFRVWTC
jgi:hypothetical protein